MVDSRWKNYFLSRDSLRTKDIRIQTIKMADPKQQKTDSRKLYVAIPFKRETLIGIRYVHEISILIQNGGCKKVVEKFLCMNGMISNS